MMTFRNVGIRVRSGAMVVQIYRAGRWNLCAETRIGTSLIMEGRLEDSWYCVCTGTRTT
jgi:hypothetical protein